MLLSLALSLALVQQQGFRTDTTVAVQQGTRLAVELAMGEVTIRTWERAQVRIRGRHSARTEVAIRSGGAVLRLEPETRMGIPATVDFEFTVPTWMAIDLEGLTLDVDAEGMGGALRVESLNGDITVRDGADLSLEAVNGTIRVTGARGRIHLSAVAGDIVGTGLDGEVTAEGVSGNIWLLRTESSRVMAETVSGRVVYQGTVRDGGSYTLASHSGPILFGLPAAANANVMTAHGSGDLSASFTLPSGDSRSRRRQTLRFGSGSAMVELETFSGNIRLVRPDEVPAWTARPSRDDRRPRDRTQGREWEQDLDGVFDLLGELNLEAYLDLALDLGEVSRGLGIEVKQAIKSELKRDPLEDARPRAPRAHPNQTER